MQIGFCQRVTSAEDMQKAATYCHQPGYFVLDCTDWQIIPAENMVATFQVTGNMLPDFDHTVIHNASSTLCGC